VQLWEYVTFTAAYAGNYLGIVKMYDNQELQDWKNRKWGVGYALKELGEQGWELVAVQRHSAEGDPVYYFKRPKA
jgi:hypothetical protein